MSVHMASASSLADLVLFSIVAVEFMTYLFYPFVKNPTVVFIGADIDEDVLLRGG